MEIVWISAGSTFIAVALVLFVQASNVSINSKDGLIGAWVLVATSIICFIFGLISYALALKETKRKECKEDGERSRRYDEFINKFGGISPNLASLNKKPDDKGGDDAKT